MVIRKEHLLQHHASHLPGFPRLIREHLFDAGFSDEDIFHDLSFTGSDLDSEAFRLNTEDHRQFIKRAIKLTGDPHLSLAMRDRATDVRTNAVLMLFAASGRISKGLRSIAHFNHVFTRTLSARLEEQHCAPVFDIECHVDDELVAYFALSSFALFVDRFFQESLGDRHLVTRAEFALSTPPGLDDVRDLFV